MQFEHDPFLIIISSPSGAGKSSLCDMIIKNDENVTLSISATTRKKRSKEINGQDYFFIDEEKYQELIKQEEFLEHAKIFSNHYGTPKKYVTDQLKNGKDVLFDIDWQGARQILEKFDSKNILKIFILPPSIEILQKRLESRAQDDAKTVENRMKEAKNEVSHYDEYDFIIINDDLEESYKRIEEIVNSYRIKRYKKDQLNSFIDKLLK
jgi:guanylate kinase